MENQIKLTKEQLEKAINLHLSETNGINELFSMVINGLMLSERQQFLGEELSSKNKGNGYRSLKKSGMGNQLELRVPRDRLGMFKPLILGILEQQEERIKDLSFALYVKGLTTRQINEILVDIYGTNYSKSSISRINTEFASIVKQWQQRPLDQYYPVIFIDATHQKVRRDTVSTEAFYVILGLKADFTREVLGITNFPTEHASGWTECLETLKQRGVEQVDLFVSDDLTGLDSSISKCFKNSKHQKCILHFQRQLSKNIRVSDRTEFCNQVKAVFNPDNQYYTVEQGIEQLKQVLNKWIKKYPKLQYTYQRDDLALLFTYLRYDYRIRRMIYTTNWIERLNKSFKRTLKIRNALPSIDATLTLMGYVAMEMENKTYKYPVRNFKFDTTFNII